MIFHQVKNISTTFICVSKFCTFLENSNGQLRNKQVKKSDQANRLTLKSVDFSASDEEKNDF